MTVILIVTAVEAERAAVERGLSPAQRESTTVVAGGVGPASAAAATAEALARGAFAAVVSAGIGGAFAGVTDLGGLLLADRIIAADLGADSAEGFQSVEELGFGAAAYDATPLAVAGAVHGALLTVTTATGTAERAAWLRERYPDAIGEAMEGYGVAVAAARSGLRAAEVRAVSNLVGPRDRAAWRIGEALAALSDAAGPMVAALIESVVSRRKQS